MASTLHFSATTQVTSLGMLQQNIYRASETPIEVPLAISDLRSRRRKELHPLIQQDPQFDAMHSLTMNSYGKRA
jgi:hypothetical protein